MEEEQIPQENYQTRLKELIKDDYPYLIMGLLVVISAGTFLYFQLSPVRGVNKFGLLSDSDILTTDVLEKSTKIANIIKEKEIDYISLTPAQDKNMAVSLPSTLSRPEENGQISAIASDQVTYAKNTYTVEEGDSLASIAGAVYGDRNAWVRIAEANDLLDNPDSLEAGMVLKIPR